MVSVTSLAFLLQKLEDVLVFHKEICDNGLAKESRDAAVWMTWKICISQEMSEACA